MLEETRKQDGPLLQAILFGAIQTRNQYWMFSASLIIVKVRVPQTPSVARP